MTPYALMAHRRVPLGLVIFDCDGVLVDSEPVANRILAEDLALRGWPMPPAEVRQRFVGMTLADMRPLAETQIGMALPPDWEAAMQACIVAALAEEAVAIPGAIEALRAVDGMGIAWCIASNSSHAEMQVKFSRLGIAQMVAGRTHSFTDVVRGKPAPDLFLAAAAAAGASPHECVVIEDSVPGVQAAVAASMDSLGFAPHDDGAALRMAGAVPFHAMAELPALLETARRRAR